MDKVIPKKYAIKKGLIDKKNEDLIRFNSISLILSAVALGIEGYLAFKYFGKDLYGTYSLMLLILGILGISGAYWLNPKTIFELNDYYLKNTVNSMQFIVSIVMTMVCVAIMQVILKISFRLALSLTDLLMYFIASAIAEELFFRMFLVSLFQLKIKIKGIGIVISSIIFMLFHIPAYWPSIEMLLAMFLGGCIFSIAFVFSKDISISMVAHLSINLISFVISTGSPLMIS